MGSAPLLCFAAFLVSSTLFSAASAVNFTCNATPKATCSGLVEYVPQNATTYRAVESLFQVTHLDLLGANNVPTSTTGKQAVSAGEAVKIPFPCSCANGTGESYNTPMYTVKAGDGLDAIARYKFSGLVTYQEIQIANKIANADLIEVGQKLRIPLPCSCDPVEDRRVVHLAHVVAAGSTAAGIAAEFGTDLQSLISLNGNDTIKNLQAGQVLNVPLQVCSSSISNTSEDSTLRVPNGTYALTANNCILCRCSSSSSSSSFQLDCRPTQGVSSSTCPAAMCGSLSIGNTSTSGCDVKTCAYGGYTNTTGLVILTNLTTQSTCSNGGAPAMGLKRSIWTELLFMFHATLFCVWFL